MNRTIPLWSGTAPLFEEAAGQSAPSLTMFPAENARGVVLVVPGGGYDHKAAHEGAPIAERLNEGGISAAVLDYRVAPYKAPVPQWDAMRAVQLLRSLAPEYGYRQDRVAILGFSAGGHLAASVTYLDIPQPETSKADSLAGCSPRPDAAVLCYPVITMACWGRTVMPRRSANGPSKSTSLPARRPLSSGTPPKTALCPSATA